MGALPEPGRCRRDAQPWQPVNSSGNAIWACMRARGANRHNRVAHLHAVLIGLMRFGLVSPGWPVYSRKTGATFTVPAADTHAHGGDRGPTGVWVPRTVSQSLISAFRG
jgi:hypothetical protein